jgi:hypothetical protein
MFLEQLLKLLQKPIYIVPCCVLQALMEIYIKVYVVYAVIKKPQKLQLQLK